MQAWMCLTVIRQTIASHKAVVDSHRHTEVVVAASSALRRRVAAVVPQWVPTAALRQKSYKSGFGCFLRRSPSLSFELVSAWWMTCVHSVDTSSSWRRQRWSRWRGTMPTNPRIESWRTPTSNSFCRGRPCRIRGNTGTSCPRRKTPCLRSSFRPSCNRSRNRYIPPSNTVNMNCILSANTIDTIKCG